MDWTKKQPKEPGYYFINDYGEELLVEVVSTLRGLGFFEMLPGPNFVYCKDLEHAEWLGPIKSEDIVNLWAFFKEDKG